MSQPPAPTDTPSPTDAPTGTAPTETGPTESRLDLIRDPDQTPCQPEDGTLCGVFFDWTGNDVLARWLAAIFGILGSILLILAVGLLLRWLLHRAISQLTDRIAAGDVGVGSSTDDRKRRRLRPTALLESPLAGERRGQRARTIGSILKSISTGVIAVIVLLMVLAEFGINVGPLVAGAGVLGVALGFGSQALVKDFLSGIFMIVEDQYGVGDVVDVGEASGTVEAVGLRVTRLRDVDGTVWYVRNGEILRVGNMSQGWARAVLDVRVAYNEDIGQVQDVLRELGAELKSDPDWARLVMEDPEVWGVEDLTPDAVVVRLVVKTVPLEQWTVARELRRRIKGRFDREGIELPFTQHTVWTRSGDKPRRPATRPEQERHEKPTGGESQVAQDIDRSSDSGL